MQIRGPGWPQTEGWMIIGFFSITAIVLKMIEKNPALLANATFMQYITTLTTGGLLVAASHYFQREKSQAMQQKLEQTMADKLPQGDKVDVAQQTTASTTHSASAESEVGDGSGAGVAGSTGPSPASVDQTRAPE